MTMPRDQAAAYFADLQTRLCQRLEALDGTATFREDRWERPGGGGGVSRVVADGAVFEKGGVNVSDVHGEFPAEFAKQLPGDGTSFTACGISLVLHPRNPFVPTVHANFRYLTHGSKSWFGGGADLTPYYPQRDDVIHFHKTWAATVRAHEPLVDYHTLKEACDRYFYLPHRNEPRGVGGIFFDYLDADFDRAFAFVQACGEAFAESYVPIAERRRDVPFTDQQRQFQLMRRGRYVEFNLIHDRGTLFGLKTAGRIESILMSLPPLARWEYDYRAEPGSPEAALTEYYLQPRDWATENSLDHESHASDE